MWRLQSTNVHMGPVAHSMRPATLDILIAGFEGMADSPRPTPVRSSTRSCACHSLRRDIHALANLFRQCSSRSQLRWSKLLSSCWRPQLLDRAVVAYSRTLGVLSSLCRRGPGFEGASSAATKATASNAKSPLLRIGLQGQAFPKLTESSPSFADRLLKLNAKQDASLCERRPIRSMTARRDRWSSMRSR
jgi:hypothetical protein